MNRKKDQTSVKLKRGIAIARSKWNDRLWPNAVVPYDIALHYNKTERSIIFSAMQAFYNVSCIRFRPRTASDKFYLQINKYYKLERCFSFIGRQLSRRLFGTPQGKVETRMRLDPSCFSKNGRGTVIHELMHVIGFHHEHQRDDRDSRIHFNGTLKQYNYKIRPRSNAHYMGKYDINSIMHYNFGEELKQPRSYFSKCDIQHINALYKCASHKKQEDSEEDEDYEEDDDDDEEEEEEDDEEDEDEDEDEEKKDKIKTKSPKKEKEEKEDDDYYDEDDY